MGSAVLGRAWCFGWELLGTFFSGPPVPTSLQYVQMEVILSGLFTISLFFSWCFCC